jgi:hypothetical protein
MPALRQYLSLRKPHPWLAAAVLLFAAAGLDGCRAPSEQLTARAYVALVRGYQWAVRPCLGNHVHCRFHPSCSEYSIAAVQRLGIFRGLRLSVSRIAHCTPDVPDGTEDPAP